MILDNEGQRAMLLEMIVNANIPVKAIGEVVSLLESIKKAQIIAVVKEENK